MKNILISLFAITALLVNGSALAAKCKYEEETADLFSGVKTVRTKWNKLTPWGEKGVHFWSAKGETSIFVSVISEGGDKRLGIRIKFKRKSQFKPTREELENAILVPAGTNLLIKLADDTVVALPALELAQGVSGFTRPYANGTDDYILVTQAVIEYGLDASAAEALTAQRAVALGIVTSTGRFDIPVTKKNRDDIKQAIECALWKKREGDKK